MDDDVDVEALAKLGPSAQHYELGRSLLRDGASFTEVRRQLSSQGLKTQFVETVVTELAVELVQPLVVAGVSADKVKERLALRGLTEHEASAILTSTAASRAAALRSRGIASGPFHAVGCVLIVAGIVVWIGNLTGLFPTVRGLGYLLMIAGAVISGAGVFWRR